MPAHDRRPRAGSADARASPRRRPACRGCVAGDVVQQPARRARAARTGAARARSRAAASAAATDATARECAIRASGSPPRRAAARGSAPRPAGLRPPRARGCRRGRPACPRPAARRGRRPRRRPTAAMWPMSSATQAAGRAVRAGRDDLLAQRGRDERRMAGRARVRRVHHVGRPAGSGRRVPRRPGQPPDGLRPHQRHVGRQQEEPRHAGVQHRDAGAHGREHPVVELGVRHRRARPSARRPRRPRRRGARSRRPRRRRPRRGIPPPPTRAGCGRRCRAAACTRPCARSDRPPGRWPRGAPRVRRPCRTAPGRSRRRCSPRARRASPRRWRGRSASGCARGRRRRSPPR